MYEGSGDDVASHISCVDPATRRLLGHVPIYSDADVRLCTPLALAPNAVMLCAKAHPCRHGAHSATHSLDTKVQGWSETRCCTGRQAVFSFVATHTYQW